MQDSQSIQIRPSFDFVASEMQYSFLKHITLQLPLQHVIVYMYTMARICWTYWAEDTKIGQAILPVAEAVIDRLFFSLATTAPPTSEENDLLRRAARSWSAATTSAENQHQTPNHRSG